MLKDDGGYYRYGGIQLEETTMGVPLWESRCGKAHRCAAGVTEG